MPASGPDWPRVLIIGPPPMNLLVGGGVTLHRLFSRWPADRLAVIYGESIEPDRSRAAYYRTVPAPMDMRPRALAHLLGRWRAARGLVDVTMLGGAPSRAMRAFVEAFDPEVILVLIASHPLHDIARILSRERGVPLVSYVPDDWMPGAPMRPVVGGRLGHILLNRLWHRGVRQTFDASAAHLAISDAMAREYWIRYGHDFTPVYNALDLDAWPAAPPPEPGERLRVVYSGSIFDAAQRDALYEVRDAVALLRERGVDAVLDVYSKDASEARFREALDRPPASALHPLVPAERMRENLRAASVLVLPLAFHETARSFMRLSMPGKVAEFMASGTPVLAYGPSGVVQVDFIRERAAGLVVDVHSVEALAEALLRLHDDRALRAEVSRRARETAEQVFSLPVVRRRFERVVLGLLGREAPE
jgi:glycosyltransferase involved in cell wall biosynthesis